MTDNVSIPSTSTSSQSSDHEIRRVSPKIDSTVQTVDKSIQTEDFYSVPSPVLEIMISDEELENIEIKRKLPVKSDQHSPKPETPLLLEEMTPTISIPKFEPKFDYHPILKENFVYNKKVSPKNHSLLSLKKIPQLKDSQPTIKPKLPSSASVEEPHTPQSLEVTKKVLKSYVVRPQKQEELTALPHSIQKHGQSEQTRSINRHQSPIPSTSYCHQQSPTYSRSSRQRRSSSRRRSPSYSRSSRQQRSSSHRRSPSCSRSHRQGRSSSRRRSPSYSRSSRHRRSTSRQRSPS